LACRGTSSVRALRPRMKFKGTACISSENYTAEEIVNGQSSMGHNRPQSSVRTISALRIDH
jgi:hypothetical protein